jgi:hypothetical protein
MKHHYIVRELVLQVTDGQCQKCRSLDVVAVLITEQNGGAGRDRNRAFYTCDRLSASGGYFVHRCPVAQAPEYVPPEAA